jgi:hypothetical protein
MGCHHRHLKELLVLTSILRTIVPYIWGTIIGWVLSTVPPLEPLRDQLLAYGDAAVPIIALVITGAWYTLWRKVEARLPDWLTSILLGSSKAPTYPPVKVTAPQIDDGELTDWHDGGRPKHVAPNE